MQRNTIQRRIILSTVLEMHNHPTAADVYSKITESCPGISRATVYRILGQLAEEGMIQHIPLGDSADRYDFTLGEHAHFVCQCCGKVFDLPLAQTPVAAAEGFSISKINVTATGLCPECAKKGTNA